MNFRQAIISLASAALVLAAAGCGTTSGTGGKNDAGIVDAGVFTDRFFSLKADPLQVTVGQTGIASVNLRVTRTNETGEITFFVNGLPAGVTAAFDPATTLAEATTLTLTASSAATLGTVNIAVAGTGANSATSAQVIVPLTVTVPVDFLLVDDDRSANNRSEESPAASASDDLFRNLLTSAGVPYNVYVVLDQSAGPTFEQLRGYKTVIWYCGSEYGGNGNINTVSSNDEINLKAFLDLGTRKVAIFSSSYLSGQNVANTWQMAQGEWLRTYVGAAGVSWDRLNGNTYTVNGAGTHIGTTMGVANGMPLRTITSPINPAAGTDTFFTALLDPDPAPPENTPGAFVQSPVAVGRRNVGSMGSSKVTLFSFPFENLTDSAAPNRKADVFAKVLAY